MLHVHFSSLNRLVTKVLQAKIQEVQKNAHQCSHVYTWINAQKIYQFKNKLSVSTQKLRSLASNVWMLRLTQFRQHNCNPALFPQSPPLIQVRKALVTYNLILLLKQKVAQWVKFLAFYGIENTTTSTGPPPSPQSQHWLSYRLDDPRFVFPKEQDIFLLSKSSKTAVGPNQPATQWLPGFFFGEKAAGACSWPISSIQCQG